MPTTAASYDGTPKRFAKSCAQSTDGTRRRVRSPSCATRSRGTSLTVVRGSTNPSTPRRVVTKSRRWAASAVSEARTVAPVGPPRVMPPRRRNRFRRPMTPIVLHRRSSGRQLAGSNLLVASDPGSARMARVGRGSTKESGGAVAEAGQFDVVVLGAGSGGYACALRAAELGLSVALVEKAKLGGTCLHVGCIPTKALLHAAEVADSARDGEHFGVKTTFESVDMSGVNRYKDGVVARLHKGLQGLVSSRQIDYVEGEGRLVDAHTIKAAGRRLVGRHVVLATGSYAKSLPGLEISGRIMTSEQALSLDTVPAR